MPSRSKRRPAPVKSRSAAAAAARSAPASRRRSAPPAALRALWAPGTASSTVDAVEREARAAGASARASASNGATGIPSGASASSPGRSQTTAARVAEREERAERLVDVALGRVRRVVVELGVREHGDRGREPEQRAVGLVGLDDEPLPRPPTPALVPVERTSPPTR